MDSYVERSKRVLISKIEDAKDFEELIVVCGIGVIGAFPEGRDKCIEFINKCYDTFLPPGTIEMLKAKAKARKEE